MTTPRTDGNTPFDLQVTGRSPSETLDLLAASAGILLAILPIVPDGTTSWHPFGMVGPGDCAAMGSLEVLVHTFDVCQGLGLDWVPPDDLAAPVVQRLFPEVPIQDGAGSTLLWATGRIGTAERPRRTDWRWFNTGT
jgi:hypothetical protein